MNYSFMKKAQSQPDLSDFCEYLKKPLLVLEDVLEKYKELKVTKQCATMNMETYHKCDQILEKHLPNMVDSFCNFTFEYRNTNKVKMGDEYFTPKEILLKNLAKIIEEIKLIEKDFNDNNVFIAVAQNKVLNNYGYQPEFSLETGKITTSKIELENQFDYESHIKNNSFKKSNNVAVKLEKPIKENVEETTSKGGISLIEILLVFGLISSIAVATLIMYEKVITTQQRNSFVMGVSNLNSGIKTLYAAQSNYNGLTNNLLKSANLISEPVKTPWETDVVPHVYQHNKERYYALSINLPKVDSTDYKNACATMSMLVEESNMVIADEKVIKSNDQKLTYDKFLLNCIDDKYHNIELVNK